IARDTACVDRTSRDVWRKSLRMNTCTKMGVGRVTYEFSLSAGLMVGLQRLTYALSLCPYAQEVAAPQFGNIPLRVMPAEQFGGHVLALSFILPAHYASPVIEIRGDADVIDSDLLDCIVNRIDKLSDRGRRDRGQDLSIPVSVFHTLGLGQSR